MKKNKLFICKSCRFSTSEKMFKQKSGGDYLYEKLQSKCHKNSTLAIIKSGCLWTCEQHCTVSFLANDKYTYHFVNLSPVNDEEHNALLKFGQLYAESQNGYILPARVPKLLQEKLLVRIPASNNYDRE